jgi:hypothetical protein
MKEDWRRNRKDGVIVTVFVWAFLFGYSVVKTIYEDHQELVLAAIDRKKHIDDVLLTIKVGDQRIKDLEAIPKQTAPNPERNAAEVAKLTAELEDKQIVINGLRAELARGAEAEPLKMTASINYTHPDPAIAA